MDDMDFKHILRKIEVSREYKDFVNDNSDYYLVHVFTLTDSEHDNIWQIGYYSKETDKIIVFEHNIDNPSEIIVHPPAEALKKEEYIQPLSVEAVSVSKEDASVICKELLKEYYSREILSKSIFLLQNLPEFGQVWNVTMVTHAFSVINAKIDASNGKILKHHKENLMNWNSK